MSLARLIIITITISIFEIIYPLVWHPFPCHCYVQNPTVRLRGLANEWLVTWASLNLRRYQQTSEDMNENGSAHRMRTDSNKCQMSFRNCESRTSTKLTVFRSGSIPTRLFSWNRRRRFVFVQQMTIHALLFLQHGRCIRLLLRDLTQRQKMRMSEEIILKIRLRFYRKKTDIISVSSISTFLSLSLSRHHSARSPDERRRNTEVPTGSESTFSVRTIGTSTRVIATIRQLADRHFEMHFHLVEKQRSRQTRSISDSWPYVVKIAGSTELFLLGCSHLPLPFTCKWFRRDGGGVCTAERCSRSIACN